jgi:hypothetical protein
MLLVFDYLFLACALLQHLPRNTAVQLISSAAVVCCCLACLSASTVNVRRLDQDSYKRVLKQGMVIMSEVGESGIICNASNKLRWFFACIPANYG